MAKTPTPKITTKKHLARLERERIMRRRLLFGAIGVVVVVLVLIAYGILDQTVLRMNKTVAQIGDQKVSLGEYQDEVRFTRFVYLDQLKSMAGNSFYLQFFGTYYQQIQNSLLPSGATTLGKDVLDNLIDDKIIAMEAEARGITVTDEEIQSKKQAYFAFYPGGTPTPVPTVAIFPTATLNATQEAWLPPTLTPTVAPTLDPNTPTVTATATLAPTAPPDANATPTITPTSGPTMTPFPTATPYTEEGYQGVLQDYLNDLKSVNYSSKQLDSYFYRQALREKVLAAVTADVARDSEYVWARHILVATAEDAQSVLDRLNNGEEWVKLASTLSQDYSNKDQGGDLGWFTTGAMVAEFEDAAFALQIGQISQPVQSQFGYHIIQLLGRETRPSTDAEYQSKQNAAFTEWLTEKRTELNVQTYDDVWMSNTPADPAIPQELILMQ